MNPLEGISWKSTATVNAVCKECLWKYSDENHWRERVVQHVRRFKHQVSIESTRIAIVEVKA